MMFLQQNPNTLFSSRRITLFHQIAFAILTLVLITGRAVLAQTPQQTTLIVFAERPMSNGLWAAFVAAIRDELTSASADTASLAGQLEDQHSVTVADVEVLRRLGSSIQILRGDQIEPGITVDKSVTVYLHGECAIAHSPLGDIFNPPHTRAVSGALGWVRMENGHIAPFIHVACTSIGQMLTQQGLGQSQDGRNRLIANGIARVILHEWIHIATQSAHHSRHGITQAEFSVADLLAHPATSKSRMRKPGRVTDPATTAPQGDSLNGGR